MPEHALEDVRPDQMQTITIWSRRSRRALTTSSPYETDQFIDLQRSDTYTLNNPTLERILLPIRSPEVALGEMETGDLDIMDVPLSEVESVEGMENV